MKKDAIVGVVCLTGSLLLYSTLGIIDEPRAVTFPRTIIIIMIILSALLLLQGLFVKKAATEKKTASYPWVRFLVLFGIIVGYLAISETLGFYFSAFLVFVVITFVLGRKSLTPRKALIWVASSAVFSGILFLLFRVVLEVQTPCGMFL